MRTNPLISVFIRFSLYFCRAAARIVLSAAEKKQYKDYDLLLQPMMVSASN